MVYCASQSKDVITKHLMIFSAVKFFLSVQSVTIESSENIHEILLAEKQPFLLLTVDDKVHYNQDKRIMCLGRKENLQGKS